MFDRFVKPYRNNASRIVLLCRRSSILGKPPATGANYDRDCDGQEAELRRWVENHVAGPYDLTIIRISQQGRAGLQSTIERFATSGNCTVGTIVVTCLDRICRGPEVHDILRVAAAAGIRIITTENYTEPRQ